MASSLGGREAARTRIDSLCEIKIELWDIENDKLATGKTGNFGPAFIRLARNVCLENDLRAGSSVA